MRRFLFIAILIAVPSILAAQSYDLETRFSVEQLREDFAVLRQSLEEGDSGLYRYSSKHEIDRMLEDAASRITAPMTEFEFLHLVAPVVAGANDGHTGWSVSPGLAEYLDTQPFFFPFKLKFIEDRVYLQRNYSDVEQVELGAEVTHINGKPVGEIVAHLLPAISSDGRVETSKYRRLESTTMFGRLFAVNFGLTTKFVIRYVSPADGDAGLLAVDGLTEEELLRRFREWYPELAEERPPIELTYNDEVPVLTVRTFGSGAYRQAEIGYAQFLEGAFGEFRSGGVRDLIIDVRNNGGGSDEYGKLLAAYLISEEFEYYESLIVNDKHFDFFEYTSRSSNRLPQVELQRNDHGTYYWTDHANLGPQQPREPTFDGNVYILINGRSFSATGEFTSVVHHHGRATFVGEESGAGYYGNTSGMGATVTLPNTAVRIQIPLVRYTMAVSGYEPHDRGLIPDYRVTPSIEDVLSGRDVEMEFVMEIIRGGRGR